VIRLFGVGVSGSVGAKVSLSNVYLNFGVQALNTTSAAHTVTLANTGDTTLTVSGITASGNFAQTNNCGSLAVSATCTINGTFTPTATGALLGAVTIVDSAGGSPHVIRLAGTGASAAGPALGFSNVSLNFASQLAGLGVTQLLHNAAREAVSIKVDGNFDDSSCSR